MYRHTHTRLTTFSERVNPVCGNLITDIRPIHNTLSHTPAVNTIVRLFGLSRGGGSLWTPPTATHPNRPHLFHTNFFCYLLFVDCGTILFMNKMSRTDALAILSRPSRRPLASAVIKISYNSLHRSWGRRVTPRASRVLVNVFILLCKPRTLN